MVTAAMKLEDACSLERLRAGEEGDDRG